MARIERVSYRAGLVQRSEEAVRLPAITIETADLAERARAARLLSEAHVHASDPLSVRRRCIPTRAYERA